MESFQITMKSKTIPKYLKGWQRQKFGAVSWCPNSGRPLWKGCLLTSAGDPVLREWARVSTMSRLFYVT